MKFHIKSSLIFLLITIILLVGMTAISASDAADTEIQDNIEHTEVSTTTSTSMAVDSVAETYANDNNLKEKETTIEKVNNTKTINKTDTTKSSNKVVKTTPSVENPNYIYVSPSGWGPDKNTAPQYQNPYTSYYNAPYGRIQGRALRDD